MAQEGQGGAQSPPASRPPAQGAGGERTGAEAAPAASPATGRPGTLAQSAGRSPHRGLSAARRPDREQYEFA